MSNLNMKSSLLLVVVVLCISVYSTDPRRGGKPSATQGPDLFVKGKYLEFAINPSGGFGSRVPLTGRAYGGTIPPSSMHKSPAKNQSRLGITVDYGLDGWNVGTPAQSGDFFLEGYSDVGWHLTWEGPSGLEEFDQSPMQSDDDDGDTTFSPYRGCLKCVNGKRATGCDETEEDCSCNLDTTAYNFIDCPFKRWDMDTVSITKTIGSGNTTTITYIGIANARNFYNSSTGKLVETGEKIRVTKVMVHKYNETYITEHTTMENIGSVALSNVALVFHIVPTPEAIPNAGVWPKNPETDFANYVSIPNQNTDGKTLVKARGPNYNITTSIGSNDQDAKAWYGSAKDWRARNGYKDLANKMWVNDAKNAFTNEILGEVVITLGFKVASFPVNSIVTKTHFWAFTQSAVNAAEASASVPFTTGITTGDISTGAISTGVTSKDLSTGITSKDLSTGITTGAMSTGVTSKDLSTGITSKDLSTGITSKDLSTGITSKDLSTGITSKDLSTGITSKDLSTGITSGLITSAAPVESTTGTLAPITTAVDAHATTGVDAHATTGVDAHATTGVDAHATTGVESHATTGIVASGSTTDANPGPGGESTTGVSGSASTTGEEPVTTGEETPVTTGEETPVTTGAAVDGNSVTTGVVASGDDMTTADTFGEPDVTTGVTVDGNSVTTGVGSLPVTTGSGIVLTNTTDTNNVVSSGNGDEDQKIKDRNVKIIASVFGVAGFILLVLCVGGIILAVRRMQKDPVV